MKNSDKKQQLEIAAYREAAQAVTCYLLHKRFKYVTINRERMKVGEIPLPKKISRPIPTKQEVWSATRWKMVFLAGLIAERILSGKCEFEDILPFVNLPLYQTEHRIKLEEFVWKNIFIDTKLLIYKPRNWKAVMVLADELLTKPIIRYHATRKIIKQAIEDYDEGIRYGISALHYSGYSDFLKTEADRQAGIKKKREKLKDEYRKRRRKLQDQKPKND
jgi:hypothetical protein